MTQDDAPVGAVPPLEEAPEASGKQPSLAGERVVARILRDMGVERRQLLGEGGEGLVFAYDTGSVLKVYKRTTSEYLRTLQALQVTLANAALPFATPEIREIRQVGQVFYTIEKKLDGRQLDDRLATLSEGETLRALAAYVDALQALHAVALPAEPYGQYLPTADRIQAATWRAFLLAKVEQRARVSWSWLERDVPRLAEKLRALQRLIADTVDEPRKGLVHGDYSQYNVLLNDSLEVSAVLDFSLYTVVGDHRLDVACAVIFPEICEALRASDLRFLRSRAVRTYSADIAHAIRLYRLVYAFYDADNYGHNQTIYAKCVEAIKNSGLD
ncbi:MAG TPA: phosphotransferase [Chloroflexota bacterium]|jgi:aminoglycoside phosphotransferase (APT) family kinase protein|nr:phosphotransferase [Chloroflexota bacterium]